MTKKLWKYTQFRDDKKKALQGGLKTLQGLIDKIAVKYYHVVTKAMNSINFIPVSVKDFSPQTLAKLVYFSRIFKINPNIKPDGWFVFPGGITLPFFNEDADLAETCCMEVPTQLRRKEIKAEKRKRTPREKKFEKVLHYTLLKRIPNKALLQLKDIQLSSANFISILSFFAFATTYKQSVKGDPVYNKKLADKCLADAEIFSIKGKWVYFLTSTYSPNHYGWSRQWAFPFHVEERGKLIKALKRKFGVQVQAFTEVTNNGYPHTHFVIYSERPLCSETEQVKTPKSVKQGKLYNFIRKHLSAPVFDLKKANHDRIAGYLVKYIAKSTNSKKEESTTSEIFLSKSERKEIMTNFFPCLFGYRAYATTFRKGKKTESPKEVLRRKIENQRKEYHSAAEEAYKEFIAGKEETDLSVFDFFEKVGRQADLSIVLRNKENKGCNLRVELIIKSKGTIFDKSNCGRKAINERPFLNRNDIIIRRKGCPGCSFYEGMIKNSGRIRENGSYFEDFPWFSLAEALNIASSLEKTEELSFRDQAIENLIDAREDLTEKAIREEAENIKEERYRYSNRPYIRSEV